MKLDITSYMLGKKSGGSGGSATLQDKTFTENGTYTADEGYDGLGNVTVDVEKEIVVDDVQTYNDFKGMLDGTTPNPVFPAELTEIRSDCFYKAYFLKKPTLPSSIKTIKNNAFGYCQYLELTKLPSNLEVIESKAFINCKKIALTELPSGLTSIGDSAFGSCSALALTELPSGLATIEANVFNNCTGLKTITFKAKPTTLRSNSFSGCTNLLTINVPWSEGEMDYAPWGATNATINYNYTGE